MRLILAFLMLAASASMSSAEINVLVSIKPIHSLVSQVMDGVGEPALIVDGPGSPHTYTLKPSEAVALEQADVIFWVGHELEVFLEKPIETLGKNAKSIALISAPGVKTLSVRENAVFGVNSGHDDHDEDHQHEGLDGHIWLSPANAKAIIALVAATLAERDPEHSVQYKSNAKTALAKLDMLASEIAGQLVKAKGREFIVFHDAYQYFETAFGISAAGAISINPENPPGAKAIAEIRARLSQGNIKCVFSEPQFDSKLVTVILEGTQAKTAVLDPLGAAIDPGPELYIQLMTNLAHHLTVCLGD